MSVRSQILPTSRWPFQPWIAANILVGTLLLGAMGCNNSAAPTSPSGGANSTTSASMNDSPENDPNDHPVKKPPKTPVKPIPESAGDETAPASPAPVREIPDEKN